VEDMRKNENQTEKSNREKKLTNYPRQIFNLISMIRPKPTLYFIGERTAANIVLTDTHVFTTPLLHFLIILYYNFRLKARTFKRQKVDKNMRMNHPHLNISISPSYQIFLTNVPSSERYSSNQKGPT